MLHRELEVPFDSELNEEFTNLLSEFDNKLTDEQIEQNLEKFQKSSSLSNERLLDQATINLVLQDLIRKIEDENKTIEYYIKCIPEPLEPLMRGRDGSCLGKKVLKNKYMIKG